MEELALTKQLYIKIVNWMQPKYSISTIEKYSNVLKYISKKYKILNRETLIRIMKRFKHQNQRAVLCIINRYCFERGVDFNIIVPKIKAQPKKLPNIFSVEEIKLMIKSAPKPYDLVIRCIFNMGAGLRISEIIKFSWNDIRWVDWIKEKDNYGIALIKSGKGSKDRVINIPKNLMLDLYKYAEECNVLNEFKIPTGNMIFRFGDELREEIYKEDLLKSDNNLWKHKYIKSKYNWFRYNIIQKYCEKSINKKIKIHQLRHSRATYLYEIEKVPVEKIQILLGHSSLNTTMLYTKINPKGVFETIKDTYEL